MSTQLLSYTNLTGCLLDWQDNSDKFRKPLGLLKTNGNDEETISNVIFPTGGPVLGLILLKLASGAITVEVAIEAIEGIVDADFDTPDFTSGALSDTNWHAIRFATTAAKPYFALKTTAGVAGGVLAQADVIVVADLNGRAYHELTAGFNCLGGDGGLIATTLPADPS